MRILYLDCISGISGDMLVGALCDLGVKPSALEWELSKLDIGDFHLHFERRQRKGIEGVRFAVHDGATHRPEQDEPGVHGHHEHGEHHGHGEHYGHHGHPHGDGGHGHGCCGSSGRRGHPGEGRSHGEIRAILSASGLSGGVKRRALAVFARIAEAEGKIHGVPPEDVGFHEVGALDSIADIVCACVAVEALAPERVLVSPLVEGCGWVDCAHGRFPVPAPATLEILKGVPLGRADVPHELITPTGAALVAEFGEGFALPPPMAVERIGYGIGSRDLADRPNVLRAVLAEVAPAAFSPAPSDRVVALEANLDDLSPEMIGAAVERIFAAGALDVFASPVQMKKSRPGVLLTVLAGLPDASRLAELVLRETSTFGVRMTEMTRIKLDRRIVAVETPYGAVDIKYGALRGETLQRAPEFESCKRVAEAAGVPVRAVYEAALAAALGS